MKENIISNDLQERQTYVPASVKVIDVTAQKIICASTILNGTDPYEREDW